MESQRFNQLVEEFMDELKERLIRKGEEYSGKIDRLENFKRAAALEGREPEQSLNSQKIKHSVSISMMVEKRTIRGPCPLGRETRG